MPKYDRTLWEPTRGLALNSILAELKPMCNNCVPIRFTLTENCLKNDPVLCVVITW